MLRLDLALPDFLRRLTMAGVHRAAPTPDGQGAEIDPTQLDLVWSVFKEFAAVEVEAARDSLHYELWWSLKDGVCGWDFCRRFVVESEGEFHHFEDVRCEVTFALTDDLKALGSFEDRCMGDDSRQVFFERVEQREDFMVRSLNCPRRLVIFQEEI